MLEGQARGTEVSKAWRIRNSMSAPFVTMRIVGTTARGEAPPPGAKLGAVLASVKAEQLPSESGVARVIRMWFDLARGPDPHSWPLMGGFRVVGQPADRTAGAWKPAGDIGRLRQ
jgi:hypothetical protein